MPVYRTARELDFRIADLPRVARPDRVLLADPRDFDVVYAINPHMRDERGALERVDRTRARAQWQALRAAFERLGLAVDVLEPLAGHPDLVFCANQALPVPPGVARDGRPRLVPSRMAHAERAGEVPHVVRALEARGYAVDPLAGPAERLEGMGDGLWHPGRRLLWAGVGPRSDVAAWEELAERYDLPVCLLPLADPDFYHLDTALALLSEDACLWFPPALDANARGLVEALVPRRIVAPEREARDLLACNACCVDGRRVLIEREARETMRMLGEFGFEALGLDTSEYLKSGGSVFCMKLMHGPGA